MELVPQIYTAKVMHKRLFPKVNQFTYSVYYVSLPLPAQKLPSKLLAFYDKDHGNRDGADLKSWAKNILKNYGLDDIVDTINLITMPRVLGYVFNPVSFFMCFDSEKKLRAVICEVHNTFGEQHCYLCAHPDHREILADDMLEAKKLFHVSPFLEREGHYTFRFAYQADKLGIWIDYYNGQQQKQLVTSLTGSFSTLNRTSLNKAFWSHPLLTLKVVFLIHLQALKLVSKGIKYIIKPIQLEDKLSATNNLTKR